MRYIDYHIEHVVDNIAKESAGIFVPNKIYHFDNVVPYYHDSAYLGSLAIRIWDDLKKLIEDLGYVGQDETY